MGGFIHKRRKPADNLHMRELRAVVLASASPRRFELLVSLGITVRVVPSGVDEKDQPGLLPEQLTAYHAEAKAQAVASREMSDLIIAADTVVDVDGIAFGKPKDEHDARRMLATLSGRSHLVHTSFVAIEPVSGAHLLHTATTRVTFAHLEHEHIAAYVAGGDPLDKAGAYGIQGRGAALVERIEGDFYTVMGFPMGAFIRRLGELHYTLPLFAPLSAARRGAA
jgi:septum formation protein